MNILLSGATGFLGGRVVSRLQQDEGNSLFALARSERSASKLEAMGVAPIHCGLNDGNLSKAISDACKPDVVIHLAAEIATQRDPKLLWLVNHEGTKNLYEAVKGQGLKKFIFTSTVVVGEANGELLTESVPLKVETEYGKTKQASETMLLKAAQEDGFPAVILRPSHIYGNGGWFDGLTVDIRKGLFRIPGKGTNWWDMAHVEDVTSAILNVMGGQTGGEIYHVVDDCPVLMKDFFAEVAKHMGKKKIGHAPLFLARMLKGRDPILAAVRSAKSSNKKLKALGWEPQYADYRSGLAQIFQEIAG